MTKSVPTLDPTLENNAAQLVTEHLAKYDSLESTEDYVTAAHLLVEVKTKLNHLEAQKKGITAAARTVFAKTGELFDPPMRAYEAVEAKLRVIVADFIDRRLPEALIEAQFALAAGDSVALQTAMRPIPQIPGISSKTVTDFEIEDFSEIPGEYFKPREVNTKLILTQLRNGVAIPGVRLIERTQISVGSK